MSLLLVKTLYFLQKNNTMNLAQEDWVSQFEADENAVILDVRTEGEFNEGSIANAINIDIHLGQGFVTEIESLDKTKNYYVLSFWNARVQKPAKS
jgi:rhodanese-related sulfurtransferase